MTVERISKRVVDAAPPPPVGYYCVWDSELAGFGLKVMATGRKVYIAQYRAAGMGRRAPTKRETLGTHGVLTAEQARTAARTLLAAVRLGSDPAKTRRERKEAPTIAELGEDFLEDVDAHRKAATAREYRRLWQKHVDPAIGSHKVESVSVTEVRRLHRAMKETPYAANRVLALLGSAFSYAESEGLRPRHNNPAHDVTPFPEKPRERFLTQEEVVRLGEVLRVAESEGLPPAPKRRRNRATDETRKHVTVTPVTPVNRFAIAAIRFLVLTGCREGEALSLKWEHVDLGRGFLRLQDTKTGNSERPLGAPAVALLAALPRLEDSPFVFPGRSADAPIRDISRLWDAVRYAANLQDVRLHDLRHTFASVSALGGKSLLIIGKLLGHKNSRTTARYAHLGDDPVKAAADQAGGDLAAWMEQGIKNPTTERRSRTP